uniref:Uncharacterized protein n=1 Tax=Anguilla anguilla TaxID=7936 RepID=A0A0E9U2Y7_ANGAN
MLLQLTGLCMHLQFSVWTEKTQIVHS